MEYIFLKIWQLAKPYYEKGRVYDIDQVEWIMGWGEKLAEVVGADKKILMPLIILHDVGYCFVDNKNPPIKDKVSKKLHAVEGAKIARKILEQVGYDRKLTEQIVQGVLEHDNWAFGDDEPYKNCKRCHLHVGRIEGLYEN